MYTPTYAEIVSTVALVVGTAGLALSSLSAHRDRSRLKVTSKFCGASDYHSAHIKVTLVNRGRRPVILWLLGGTTKDNKWSGEFMEQSKGGLRLGENERHDLTFEKDDTIWMSDDDDMVFERLWVEDSLGNRHEIPDSPMHIKKLWE